MLKFAKKVPPVMTSPDWALTVPAAGSSVTSGSVRCRQSSPSPPPLPVRAPRRQIVAHHGEDVGGGASDGLYRTVSSGRLCRTSLPVTPNVRKMSSFAGAASPTSVGPAQQQEVAVPKGVLKRRSGQYDFHRAVERLVEKMDLQLLDTSSESGYGSDPDSPVRAAVVAAAAVAMSSDHHQTLNAAYSLDSASPLLSLRSSCPSKSKTLTLCSPPPPPLPARGSRSLRAGSGVRYRKKEVRFDSYVMLLQGLRERQPDTVQAHIDDVNSEAMRTPEVTNAMLDLCSEGRADMLQPLLARGADPNAADSAGMTGLHLAARGAHAEVLRLLVASGAAIFARSHSSGLTPSQLVASSPASSSSAWLSCLSYLRCAEECLGATEGGRVFAAVSRPAGRPDELELVAGSALTVIRRGDYPDSCWWWCGDAYDNKGYVLRDLLSLRCPVSLQPEAECDAAP